MPTALGRAVAAVLLALAWTFGAPTASAHTVLTSSDPAADATMSAGPARVSATFNEELQPAFAAMTVVGPDGNLWSSGDPEVRGAVVAVPLRPLGPAGRYTVNYRVTSADGHVVTGSWSFTVNVPGTGVPGPAAASTGEGSRIPLWPFIVGSSVLVAAAAAWGLRRRS
ncbi:MAG: copper resistance CopC family protein [Mycobacterium sp.]